MTDINLYTLSNKIRTILLTTIDKEINSKKNHLLINSQNQEQIMKKYITYQDFTIEFVEQFVGIKKYGNNSLCFDFSCNYSDNKLSYFCNSSKMDNECLLPQNFISKSLSPKKNKENSRIKKIKNSKILENNYKKLKIDSGKQLIEEIQSSLICRELINLNNSVSLSNYNNKEHIKKLTADLNIYSINNKNDDSSKLLSYCYKFKKPNDEIINEISDDDTSKSKNNKNKLLFPFKTKYKHKKIPKKKLKKIINKKKIINRNNYINDNRSLISPIKKNSTNFTNEMKFYFANIEKPNSKEKIKIKSAGKKLSNIELKRTDAVNWKNILKLHNCNSKSPEKKSKGKKLEYDKKAVSMQIINKKPANKKSHNFISYFKSIDNIPIILKYREKKEKVKKRKSDVSISINVIINKQFKEKKCRSSKILPIKNDSFQQNEMFDLRKKIEKSYVNKVNENIKNEKTNIKISNNNCNINNKLVNPNNFKINK